MMVDTYHVRLQKQGSRCNKHVSGANRYLHLPPIGKPAQYSTAGARLLCEFSPSADIFRSAPTRRPRRALSASKAPYESSSTSFRARASLRTSSVNPPILKRT